MANSNLVITGASTGAPSLTLFATKDGATNRVVYVSKRLRKIHPWERVAYVGDSSIDLKFMGGKPIIYVVSGYVFGDEAAMKTAMALITNLTAGVFKYTVTGPISNKTSDGMAVGDIETGEQGNHTGPKWTYTFELWDLG